MGDLYSKITEGELGITRITRGEMRLICIEAEDQLNWKNIYENERKEKQIDYERKIQIERM